MYFELDGSRYYAAGRLVEGDTRPVVVLLHGAAMDHSVWVYHTRYFLYAGRSVLAFDLPAHGLSAGAAVPTIEGMATWLERALDTLGVAAVAVAGHSMGALVALEFAARAGARAERLALLGAAVPMAVSPQLLDEARADSQAARDMMVLWGHGAQAHLGGNPVAGLTIANGAMRLLERARPGLLFNDLNACNDYEGGAAAAPRVQARTRLICGDEDKMTPPRVARELAAVIPQCTVDVIPVCGHIMMSERPEHTHRGLVAALS
ncbi:MAG: alpha/beta hydrolase [Gammaproteobacteria bacterium]|nr:alpha/beta hydrolase [Gammaproteobacteria bacterium]